MDTGVYKGRLNGPILGPRFCSQQVAQWCVLCRLSSFLLQPRTQPPPCYQNRTYWTGCLHPHSDSTSLIAGHGRTAVGSVSYSKFPIFLIFNLGLESDPVHIQSIEISPDPPQPGKDLTIKVKATVTEPVEVGSNPTNYICLHLCLTLSAGRRIRWRYSQIRSHQDTPETVWSLRRGVSIPI